MSARVEDIREKISRLRARAPPPEAPAAPPPERRRFEIDRRFIAGLIVLILIIAIVAGAAAYYLWILPRKKAELQLKKELEDLRKSKLEELEKKFSGDLAASPVKEALRKRILAARTKQELLSIDISAVAALESARLEKIKEMETYFSGPLANHRAKEELLRRIRSATSIDEIKAIDVESVALKAWREYLKQQVYANKDESGRVKVIEILG